MAYNPRSEQAAILDRAYELVQSVPYQVSARWLFYGLLQEGVYPDKESYKGKFLPLIAKARKEFYKDWRPDTLADDTRIPVVRGDGFTDEMHWLQAIGQAECTLDKWINQSAYVECWFEAKAMRGQFEYFTKYITLRPFGGDPSIPCKWAIAKEIERAWECYQKPIIIIYFGDLDPKGLIIPESAIADIRNWCSVDFAFIRAGLNPGDEKAYNIMENPEKPGTYQWEALTHDTAGRIITRVINDYIDFDSFMTTERQERSITEEFQKNWRRFIA